MENITNEKNKGNDFDKGFGRIFQIISGAFLPLIPILAGSGMLNSFISILVSFNILSENSNLYVILSATGNGVFYFLPIFLGITLSKQFGANPYVGGAIGAVLLEPSFTELIGNENMYLLGMPFAAMNYSATVFPIFLISFCYAFLEKVLKKIIYKELHLFLLPMICLLLIVPFSILIVAPFGIKVGNIISEIVMQLFYWNRFLAGAFLGIGYPLLMIFGLHWGFTPITIQNLSMYGGDMIEGIGVCCVYAQLGSALAIYVNESTKEKSVIRMNILTGILAGVTEPILYSLLVKDRVLILIVAISGGIGGIINAVLGVNMKAYVFHNIFSIFMMSYSPVISFLIGILSTFFVSFLFTMFYMRGGAQSNHLLFIKEWEIIVENVVITKRKRCLN